MQIFPEDALVEDAGMASVHNFLYRDMFIDHDGTGIRNLQ